MKRAIGFLFGAALGIGAGLVLAVCFSVTDVTDNSMLPAFSEGDGVLLRRNAYDGGQPAAGDVILFPSKIYTETGEDSLMLKRVIGVPGDRVMITGGNLYINNRQEKEDYVFTPGLNGEMEEVTVPAGHVFVLGDNRAASTDSRSDAVGFVEIESIEGKVIFQW